MKNRKQTKKTGLLALFTAVLLGASMFGSILSAGAMQEDETSPASSSVAQATQPENSASTLPEDGAQAQIQPAMGIQGLEEPAGEPEMAINVHAYLVNAQGKAIKSDGTLLPDGEKEVFATYPPRTEYSLALDTEIQYYAEDKVTGSNGLTYQFAGAIAGSDDPAVPVTLTAEEPVKDVYLAYTAKRTITLYKKDAITDLGWKTFKTDATIMVGSEVSIADFYQDAQNPIGLPVTLELLGWDTNNTGTTIQYPVTQQGPSFIMADKNISLYAVLKSHVQTGKIHINQYLFNSAGLPVTRAGEVLPTDDKTNWVLLGSYYYTMGGSEDIPLNTNVKPFTSFYFTLNESGKDTKYNYLTSSYKFTYIADSDTTFKLQTAGEVLEVAYGYVRTFNDTFHTNYPAGALSYTGTVLPEFSWVQSYADSALVALNAESTSEGGSTALYQLKEKMPKDYKFLGWSYTQNPVVTTPQELIDIQQQQTFYPATTRSFAQPYQDLDLYAVWGLSELETVKLNQDSVVPYLVNYDGKAINWDGSLITSAPFPADIVKISPKNDFYFTEFLGNAKADFVPGVYYDLYPMKSFAGTGYTYGSPLERTFKNNVSATKYGATAQPVRVTVDEDGYLRDENGAFLTLYYGYNVEYQVVIHSNYPADTNKTNVVSKTTQDKVWGWNPTYGFFTELKNAGYTFYGFETKQKDANGNDKVGFLYAYAVSHDVPTPQYSDVVLTAQWVPNSQVKDLQVYAYWVDYYGRPLDADGYVISNAELKTKGVLLQTGPFYTTPLPYVAGGSTYDIWWPFYIKDSIIGSTGKTYVKTSNAGLWQEDLTTRMTSPLQVNDTTPSVYYYGYTSENKLNVNLNPPKELGVSAQNKVYSSLLKVHELVAYTNLKRTCDFEEFEGYVFVGWSYDKDGLNTIIPTIVQSGYTYIEMPAHEATVYAQWKKDDSQSTTHGNITLVGYTVNDDGKPINAAGAVVANPTLAQQVRYYPYQNEGSTSLSFGYTYRPAALNFTLGNTRYVYNSKSEANGGNVSMSPLYLDQNNKNVVLYFGYSAITSYIVNYDANFPQGTSAAVQTQIGQPVYANNRFAVGELVKSELANYTNSALPASFNYQFAGWTECPTPAANDAVYSTTGNGFTMPAHNVQLYAKWEPLYTVEFLPGQHGTIRQANAGSNMLYTKLVNGSVLPAAPQLIPENGWEFNGWTGGYSATGLVQGNMQFVAQWKQTPEPESTPSSIAPSSSITPSSSSRPTSSSSSTPVSSSSSSTPASSVVPASSSTPTSAPSQNTASSAVASSTPNNGGTVTSAASEEQARKEVTDRLIDAGVPSMQLGENKVPLFGFGENFTWSLLSLILAIAGILTSIIAALRLLLVKGWKTETARKVAKLVSIILGVVSLIVFFLVYDLRAAMVVIDARTIIFAILFVCQLIVLAIAKQKNKQVVEDDV